MSSPTARTRGLRGVLVGVCSALLSTAAHTAGGAELPGGAALVLVTLACAVVGALSSSPNFERRVSQLLTLSAALGLGQVVGHIVLVAAAHHDCPAAPSLPMLAAHGLAAVACGLLVGFVEHLYGVGAQLLCWLRLFHRDAPPPVVAVRSWPTVTVAVRRIAITPVGTRAPPRCAMA
ncbi:hypothetical protein [Mycolicibacterium phlei]